jgi:phage FluMu gp28-like protein
VGLAFDATGNGGYLAEQAALKYGTEMVDQVHLSQSWYHEWMPKMKGEFEAFNLEIPRHQSVLDDLQHIKLVNGIPSIDKGRKADLESSNSKGKRHGDFAVGLCMAVRASYMEGGAIEFTALPKSTSRWDANSNSSSGNRADEDDYCVSTKGGW